MQRSWANANTSLVIGYPEETKETIDETMSKLEDLNVYPSAGFAFT